MDFTIEKVSIPSYYRFFLARVRVRVERVCSGMCELAIRLRVRVRALGFRVRFGAVITTSTPSCNYTVVFVNQISQEGTFCLFLNVIFSEDEWMT